MTPEIRKIKLGIVNCYLVKTDKGYFLIDTGFSTKRGLLEKEIESAGCTPGNLKLIIITHGDFDHTGNCAYLSKKYGVKIAMHRGDSGMVEFGNMLWNRKLGSKVHNRIIIKILLFLFRLNKFEKFKPDIYLEDGQDLSEYGFDAKVIHNPGHSSGSIGISTSSGEFFCGDLLMNNNKPMKTSLIDCLSDLDASIEKVKSLNIGSVYPGHGEPFPMEQFLKSIR